MKNVVKKAVLPIAGLGTRFLPLSKTFPKELWPLINRPIIDYIVEEAKNSGAKEIVFVLSKEKKIILDYFKANHRVEKVLKERGKKDLLKQLREVENNYRSLSFSAVMQKKPLGDGHAILQARNKVGQEPCLISFGDDLVVSKTPCLRQLSSVFQKYGQPVVALKRVPREKISSYGVVQAKKLGPRLYQIERIVEKPKARLAPSNLAVVGKYILTPQVFSYLGKAKLSFRGEIILAETLEKMIQDGIMIYGYEFEGKWLECGNLHSWLKSNLFLAKKLKLF